MIDQNGLILFFDAVAMSEYLRKSALVYSIQFKSEKALQQNAHSLLAKTTKTFGLEQILNLNLFFKKFLQLQHKKI